MADPANRDPDSDATHSDDPTVRESEQPPRPTADPAELDLSGLAAPETGHDIDPPTFVVGAGQGTSSSLSDSAADAEPSFDASGATVESCGTAPTPTVRDAATESGLRPDLPASIGQYQTLGLLGEGSFGMVLRCRDPKLDRIVAVKLAKLRRGTTKAARRFLAEARAAAQLRHPHIVPVYEYGERLQGHFIAYQFVAGQTLQQLMAEGLPVSQAVELMVPIARAMAYAHRQGIVHRDLKPANILVDEQGQPQVADFGCAKLLSDDVTRTVDGSLLGTPAYMSPEAAAGKANQADGRSDIWSLGVILFEMLAGQRPFSGGFSRVLADIQLQQAPRVRDFAPQVPKDLETLVEKCLQRDLPDRMADADELANELERWQRSEPIRSRRTSLWRRARLWTRRNPRWAAMWSVLAMFIVLIAAGSLLFSWQLQQRQQQLIASQVRSLMAAVPAEVPRILEDLREQGDLAAALPSADSLTPDQRLRLAAIRLQNMPLTPAARDEEFRQLLDTVPRASADELRVLAKVLHPPQPLAEAAWQRLPASPPDSAGSAWANSSGTTGGNVPLLALLAQLDPANARWENWGPSWLAAVNQRPQQELAAWLQLMEPVRGPFRQQIQPQLEGILASTAAADSPTAHRVLIWLVHDDIEYLAELATTLELNLLPQLVENPSRAERILAALQPDAADPAGSEQPSTDFSLRLALMEALLGKAERMNRALQSGSDSTLRTELILSAPEVPLGIPMLFAALQPPPGESQPAAGLAAGILQMLRQYPQHEIENRMGLTSPREQVLQLFAKHPAAEVHSSAESLLRHWGLDNELAEARRRLRRPQPLAGYGWHEDPSGLCFAIFEPETFLMGEPGNRGAGRDAPFAHQRLVDRRFGISTTEVTWEQFLALEQARIDELDRRIQQVAAGSERELLQKRLGYFQRLRSGRKSEPSALAADKMTWVEAALCCEQLNLQQGMPTTYQLSYRDQGRVPGITHSLEVLSSAGYRLPTSGEWELAARCGGLTRYTFGNRQSRMGFFGWTIENSRNQVQPVGELLPNRGGLFDMQGNVSEWCHDSSLDYAELEFDWDQSWPDGHLPPEAEELQELRECRDLSYAFPADQLAVFGRSFRQQGLASAGLGFRIARTYESGPLAVPSQPVPTEQHRASAAEGEDGGG